MKLVGAILVSLMVFFILRLAFDAPTWATYGFAYLSYLVMVHGHADE